MQILLFTYFYFLSKDHQLAYFNMFMPLEVLQVNHILDLEVKNH